MISILKHGVFHRRAKTQLDDEGVFHNLLKSILKHGIGHKLSSALVISTGLGAS